MSHRRTLDRHGCGTFAVFCGVVLASWVLRPPSRKLGDQAAAGSPSAMAWSVPLIITAAMLAVAYINVPTGSLPQ